MANQSREAGTRLATSRPAIGGEFKGRLWVDPATLDPGCDYQWIRESAMGERDEGNLQMAMDENGFAPVDAKELPGAAGARLPGQKAADGLIRRGGLILMKRSKEIAQDQQVALREANDAAVAGVTKDLSALQDGKYVQNLPGAQVHSSMETTRVRPGGESRFAE
jgi:hypothetical protein